MLPHSRWSGRVAMPRGPGWVNSGQGGVAACLIWCNGLTSTPEANSKDSNRKSIRADDPSNKGSNETQEPSRIVLNNPSKLNYSNEDLDRNKSKPNEFGSQVNLLSKVSPKLFAEDKVIEAVKECLAKESSTVVSSQQRPESQRRPPKHPPVHYQKSLNLPCHSRSRLANTRKVAAVSYDRRPHNLTVYRSNTPQLKGTRKTETEHADRKLQRPSTAPPMKHSITTFDGSVVIDPCRRQPANEARNELNAKQTALVEKVRQSEERFNQLLEELKLSLSEQKLERRNSVSSSCSNNKMKPDDLWKMSRFTENAKPRISTRWGQTQTDPPQPQNGITKRSIASQIDLQQPQHQQQQQQQQHGQQQPSRAVSISQSTQTQQHPSSSRPGSVAATGQSILNRVNLNFECEPDSDTLVNLRLKSCRKAWDRNV